MIKCAVELRANKVRAVAEALEASIRSSWGITGIRPAEIFWLSIVMCIGDSKGDGIVGCGGVSKVRNNNRCCRAHAGDGMV